MGFEPTVGKSDTRFPGVPVKPLQHLSAIYFSRYLVLVPLWFPLTSLNLLAASPIWCILQFFAFVYHMSPWRRGWDSNPRGISAYRFSRAAPSTTRSPLPKLILTVEALHKAFLLIMPFNKLVLTDTIILWGHQFIKAFQGSLLEAGSYMGICIESYLYGSMTQSLLDDFGMYSLLEHEGRRAPRPTNHIVVNLLSFALRFSPLRKSLAMTGYAFTYTLLTILL